MAVPAAHEKKTKTKHMSVPALIAVHLLCIGLGLIVFAYFHHVRDYYAPAPAQFAPVSLITPSPVPSPTADPAVSEGPEATPRAEEVREDRGAFYDRFPDKFTDGEIIRTEDTYISKNINVTVTKVQQPELVYHVAEIYISDMRYLRSAFGEKGYGSRGMAADLASANDAVTAISGDYYSARKEGIVIRNGVLYRETLFEDICVLLSDGRMITLNSREIDMDELKQAAPWQVWSFGPALLLDGEALTEIHSTVARNNPRSAIGYAEPGHYFFVQVDGRGAYGSRGMTLQELARLFEELGCQTAYNLDGGQTAGFVWNGELQSYPYGRSVSDIIYITDQPAEED